jgi:hypothetical protein
MVSQPMGFQWVPNRKANCMGMGDDGNNLGEVNDTNSSGSKAFMRNERDRRK